MRICMVLIISMKMMNVIDASSICSEFSICASKSLPKFRFTDLPSLSIPEKREIIKIHIMIHWTALRVTFSNFLGIRCSRPALLDDNSELKTPHPIEWMVGQSVEVRCKRGYGFLFGSAINSSTCGDTGEWIQNFPKCHSTRNNGFIFRFFHYTIGAVPPYICIVISRQTSPLMRCVTLGRDT